MGVEASLEMREFPFAKCGFKNLEITDNLEGPKKVEA